MFAVQVTVLLLVMSSLPYFTYASLSVSPVTMTTSLGDVTGVRKTVGDNKKVDVFYGIPFARPPVGDLRFNVPVAAEPWEGVRDATQKPNSCWQVIDTEFDRFPGVDMWNPNTQRSEDCLYLNVWRPVCMENCSRSKPKAIMVWIFGGGFYAGTTTLDLYDGSQLAVVNDVIVVSIAYRLGVMGFLSMDTEEAPGNAGLLDQAMALKWVKDNAVLLGGSPDDITLFGESAGAASVGYHLLSPLSRDLFTYAIMESATPLSYWAFQEREDALRRTSVLAENLSCTGNNSSQILSCLRSVDPEILVNAQWSVSSEYVVMPFAPIVDGNFLPDRPLEMMLRGDIKNTSIILGVNKDEGIYFDVYGFQQAFPLSGNGQVTEDQFNDILQNILHNDSQLVERVKQEYSRDPNLTYTDIIDDVSGDTLFKCPVVDFAQLYSRLGGRVFLYSFEHRVSTNPWPEWLGVAHGYEIEIFFGLPLAPDSGYTQEERELSLEVTKLLTHFASTGNPNTNQSIIWPEYTLLTENHIVIDTHGFRISHSLRHRECQFWNDVYSQSQLPNTEAKRTIENVDASLLLDEASLQTQRHQVVFAL